jgi:hypothetical protein
LENLVGDRKGLCQSLAHTNLLGGLTGENKSAGHNLFQENPALNRGLSRLRAGSDHHL